MLLLLMHYVLGVDLKPSCMIRISLSRTSMYRAIEMLCLISIDRSQVTACHSRDIGCLEDE